MNQNLFEIIDLLSESDLNIVVQTVEDHLSSKLGETIALSDYHHYATPAVHQSLSPKRERVLAEDSVSRLLSLPSFRKLLNDYPGHQIGSVVYDSLSKENRPQLYFGLVRPNQLSDIGKPHCDYWFHDADDLGWPRGNTIKFWVALCIEKGLNGLLFYPSAPSQVPFRIIDLDGVKRPVIDCDATALGPPLLPHLTSGQALKFNDDVLHCGAVNQGLMTRVSMEVTMVPTK